MSFTSFHLAKSILSQVEVLKYTHPTPIQRRAIPIVLQGKDVMGLAQTGTGKTAAFVLPILQQLLQGPRNTIRALIIAPTRELVEQTNAFITIFGKQTGLRSLAVYGGINSYNQIKTLRKGVEIVVACPGRMIDHLQHHVIDLKHLEILVLDEADRMFDMGFLPDIKKILHFIPAKRQTLLFSATMPESIQKLAYSVLRDPCLIEIEYTTPLKSITHFLFPVEQHLKTSLLLKILENTASGPILIFTRTKHRAKNLGENLKRNGFSAIALQGNLSQNKRKAALNGFRDGSFQILVATDIAARGIDVSNITHVINYDIPDTPDAYTHRTGRTGRAGNKGEAFTFVTQDDLKIVHTLERHVGVELKCRTVNNFNYNAERKPDTNRYSRGYQTQSRRKKRVKAS
ncbi:MAG: DEAD/DEAH box helicase [Spirochaetales bacterium]|nr:DEAD/DEAH box helicase [Spirochaetales bacterium]